MSVVYSYDWHNWKRLFNKKYYSNDLEAKRKAIWHKNRQFIEEHNKKKLSFTLALNQFADLEDHEFAKKNLMGTMTGGYQRPDNNGTFRILEQNFAIPNATDWRSIGAMTPVKNQEHCGACWAFAATGSLEAAHFIKYSTRLSLSEQQLIDCSGSYGNEGCKGGNPALAFKYIRETGGINLEMDYPYERRDGQKCRFDHERSIGAQVSGSQWIKSGAEDDLQFVVGTYGPVAAGMNAALKTFAFYKGGVYYDNSCRSDSQHLDHGVLVAGYGVHKGIPYWLVKNSWSVGWGENGYFRIARNANNMCGIATSSCFPHAK